MKSNPNDKAHDKDRKIGHLHRKSCEMTMDAEILKKVHEIYRRDTNQPDHFEGVEDAREAIETWVTFYNEQRPHQSLGYLNPDEFRAQFQITAQVA